MDADGEAATTAAAKSNEKGGEKCPDFEPPQAVVNRIMKGVLPDSVQVTKDARSAFSRAAGVFIFYLTHCANDISKERKRSTIYASDVFHALGELDYEDFKKPVEEFLKEHKTEQERKKQKTRDERPVDASAEDDIEPNPAAAIEEEREDEDIDEDAEEEPEEEEGEANAAMAEEE